MITIKYCTSSNSTKNVDSLAKISDEKLNLLNRNSLNVKTTINRCSVGFKPGVVGGLN